MSQDYKAQGTNKKRARKGGGGGAGAGVSGKTTATAQGGPTEAVDLQQAAGNSAVAQLIAQEQKKQSAKAGDTDQYKLPDHYRGRILSDSGLMSLATAVFAESTPAREKTDEMLAIASVAVNQVKHVQQNSQDQALFGGAKLDDVLENKGIFLNAGLSRHATFHSAARFNTGFSSQEDVNAAKAAIDAASQVMLSGNPFNHDYVVFSRDRNSPLSERTDQASATKIGKFYFWALSTESVADQDREEEQQPELAPSQMLPMTPPNNPLA